MVSLTGVFNTDFSYPGIGIKVELIVLQEYLNHFESGVDTICEQYIFKEIPKYAGCDREEFQHIFQIAEVELPRILKLPFIVSVYTLYESSITQLLNYAKTKEKCGLSLRDLDDRKSITSKFNKYMTHVLNYEFQFEGEFLEKISKLCKVRNCIAHANGNMDAMNQEAKKSLEHLIELNVGITSVYENIDVSYSYLSDSFFEIERAIKSLMNYMETRYKFI